MATLSNYFHFLFWTSLPMVFSLFLFINGFFLRRAAILDQSNCTYQNNYTYTKSGCLEARSRVVLLIVDALKYEFVEMFDNNASKETFHRNKMPIINATLERYPKHSRLFKFIADPPTTTSQRLKSLTTGTLPTFLDMEQNFAAGIINEDNFISQNEKNGNVFIGDDTWINLYPKKFLRQFAVHSFRVSDLDSVDIKVKENIFPEIEKTDWSLLIGHTLGIDHCGHKHGMHHPEMTRKLKETNHLIEEIIDKINQEGEDTVLFVVGDHGMTESGDHGGDSADETESAMFVYSTKPLIDLKILFDVEKKSDVNQIDIVPTISVILGIPIPFSNVGKIVIEAIPKDTNDFEFILHSVQKNIFQIQYYIDKYSTNNFVGDENQLETIKLLYKKVIKKLDEAKTVEDFKAAIDLSNTYFHTVRSIFLKLWVQFDSDLMSRGLLIFFCSLFDLFLILNGLKKNNLQLVLNSSFLLCIFFTVLLSLNIILLLYFYNIIDSAINTIFFICGLVPIILFTMLVIQKWDVISATCYETNMKKKNLVGFCSRIILLATVFGVFSNSYVIEEDRILSYLLITLFCLFIYLLKFSSNSKATSEKTVKNTSGKTDRKLFYVAMCPVIICLFIRGSMYFWRMREEQREMREESSNFVVGKAGSIVSKKVEIIAVAISILSLAFYVSVVKIWLRSCGNLSGFSPCVILTRFCPDFMVVIISGYWILKLYQNSKVVSSLAYQINCMPLMIYVLFICAITLIFCKPLTVFLFSNKEESISIYQEEATIPKIYEKVKNLIYKKKRDKSETPVVFGLGTVYSATYLLLTLFFSILYCLLLGFTIAPSVVLMNLACAGLLLITAVDRLQKASSLEELVTVPNSVIICWFFIAEYFFFGTGHQSSFSTIHWDAAFIGFDNTLNINALRLIFIVINTFGSHIILGLTIPLLVVAPFTIGLMFPYLTKKSKVWQSHQQSNEGEFVLFANNLIFYSEICYTCGKYILFHGFKVFVCMMAATVHCRHLMVWKIFAPKLIFEGISFLLTILSILMSVLLLMSVERNISKFVSLLSKDSIIKKSE